MELFVKDSIDFCWDLQSNLDNYNLLRSQLFLFVDMNFYSYLQAQRLW